MAFEMLQVRLTVEEYTEFKRRQAESGLKTRGFIVHLLNTTHPPVAEEAPEPTPKARPNPFARSAR